MKRKAKLARNTTETQIQIDFKLDGSGKYKIDTEIPFLNHMLELFTKHGLFDLTLKGKGDIHIDLHHTVEDVGITLGNAFKKALGEKKGIRRYGSCTLPMDEVLTTVALDFSGRPCMIYHVKPLRPGRIGTFDVEMVPEFFQGFTNAAQVNLHINVWYGKNRHHIVESIFKAFAKACDMATQIDPRMKGIPSTKGML